MTTRWRIFSLGDTAVYLHLGTVLFGAYMVLMGHGLALCISMVSIFLHELAHAAVSLAFGRPARDIEFTPLGCLMRLEDETLLSPGRRLMMLCAGPLASLLLCWLALLGTRFGWVETVIGRRLFCCNLLLTMVNLLPALPLDGGRILALLLSRKLRGETVRTILRASGTILGLCCIGVNLWLSIRHGGWNLSCAMVGCFLMYAGAAGTASFAMDELRRLMERKRRIEEKGVMACRWLSATPETPLRKAVASLPPAAYGMICLVDPVDMKLLGQADEQTLLNTYLEQPGARCKALLLQSLHDSSL